MKNLWIKTSLVLVLAGLFIGCGPSHRLVEYHFKDLRAAATITAPPAASITTERQTGPYTDDPVTAAIRFGTTLAKHAQLARTRARLDSALRQADMPQRIQQRVLSKGADYLQYTPTEESHEADLLLDIRIEQYGLRAESWRSRALFHMELSLMLIDKKKGIVIWQREVREHMPISQNLFGISGSMGNILTVVNLSRLSTQELVQGFLGLADYTSDMMISRLKEDYLEIRSP